MVSSERRVRFRIGKKPKTFESFWELWSGAQAGTPSKSSERESRESLNLAHTGGSAGRAGTRLHGVSWGPGISVTGDIFLFLQTEI